MSLPKTFSDLEIRFVKGQRTDREWTITVFLEDNRRYQSCDKTFAQALAGCINAKEISDAEKAPK